MTIMKLRLGVRGMMWLTLVIMMWGIISCRTQEEKCLEEVLSLPLANTEELQKRYVLPVEIIRRESTA